jgi:uncharacterized delta-60 repeat protein
MMLLGRSTTCRWCYFFALLALSTLLSSFAYAQFGDGTGQVRMPKTGTDVEFGEAIAIQDDGKIVIAGNCIEGVCIFRLNADGSTDTSFNAAGAVPGKVVLNLIPGLSTAGITYRLAVDENQRIVLALTCRETRSASVPNRFCIARLTPAGDLDASFSGPSGAAGGAFLIPITTDNNTFRALRIVRWTTLGGETRRRLVLVGGCGVSFQCLAALNHESGALDTSFSPPNSALGAGLYSWQIAPSIGNVAKAVISQTGNDDNGKIVVAGDCSIGGISSICLTKFNTDGSFDVDFDGPAPGGGNGAFILFAARAPGNPNRLDEAVRDLAEAGDGRYYVLCYQRQNTDSCIYRLNRDGSLDTSFDNGQSFPSLPGRAVVPSAGTGPVRLAVDASLDGLRYAPVYVSECNGPCVTRLRGTTGVLDTTLTGPNGDAVGEFYFDPGVFNDAANDIAVTASGELYVVGTCNGRICVIRFKQNGSLFTSECRRNVDGDAQVSAASDGMTIVRWMRGVTPALPIPAGLGYDIDGDGAIDASRDGVLLVRRMLGFSGDALVTGIAIASHANRKTPAQIESYLRTRCGIPLSPPAVP